MIQPGDAIGPYTLVRTLGRGAFGEVWLADRATSLITTQVALKLPLDATADLDAVRQEAQIWLKASGHTNIVPVLDAEVYDGQVVIASEFMAGGSLADWLVQHDGKASSVEAAVKMALGLLDGLQHLHECGLIHRDLKPANVLLQRGRPRLTDFGLTRVLRPSGHTTNLAGTPGYMAPEAFQGKYSPASDVWAAGMLLHELLVGSLPYAQTDFYALLLAITSEEPVAISDQVPEPLRPVLARALAKPIADRFSSAAEMVEALTAAMAPRPAASALTANHNLPVQTTSFVGRQKEIAEIKTLLGKTRLLALTGSGGCGKTRLSLQIAAEVLDEYPEGVWFIELAPLADPSLVPAAVANALSVKEAPGEGITQTLARALKNRQILLVLDNCEHLLDACSQLVDTLLHACPDIKVLASSRQGLNIAGELTYRVPSLSLPQSGQAVTVQSVRDCEAVLLFTARALFHQPSFSLTDSNAPVLASICRRLDGIPLAIELAAARVRSLTVEELGRRLDNRFRLLTGGSRTALPRQQTLRALIDWSYDLLEESQKALLCRLSVFAGGWSLEAAETVCAGGVLEEWEILDLLTALCDKSLLAAEAEGGHTRYRLLETVRQYARDRLVESGEAEAMRERHRACFLTLAEEAEPQLTGAKQAEWLDRLAAEHENLRAALEHSVGEAGASSSALRLCGALQRYWLTRGHLSEGREWCERVLNGAGAHEQTKERAKALNGAGVLACAQGDYASARSFHDESLVIRREIGDRGGIASSLNNLGGVAFVEGDYASARAYYEESLVIKREIGDRRGLASSFSNLGSMVRSLGDYVSARSFHEESLVVFREIGDRSGLANALGNLGDVACSLGDYASARSFHEESLVVFREIGDRLGIDDALNGLGDVASNQGDYASARAYYEESLALCREIGLRRGIASSLEAFAGLAAKLGAPRRTAVLWGAAEALRKEIGSPLSQVDQARYDQDVAATRVALGKKAFAAAWSEGRAMTMEQAIEYALEGSVRGSTS